MDYLLNNNIIYENNLNIEVFSSLFNDTSQCYKFYWFEALVHFIPEKDEISCDEIINEMIYEAWKTVTYYHLHLGPTINGKAENFLEHAIGTIANKHPNLTGYVNREELYKAIKKCDEYICNDKKHLLDYVPHRLLSPFFKRDDLKEGLNYIKNDAQKRLITYMSGLSEDELILYYLVEKSGQGISIHVNKYWKKFIIDNYSIILSWIQHHKAIFIQARNPGVPGIVDKIEMVNEDKRKLEQVRKLWKMIEFSTGEPIRDIYTGEIILENELSIDHFIPRSYVSNDELWNLVPMLKTLNSSKNNKLPQWKDFFLPFANYQYYMFDKVFNNSECCSNNELKKQFEACKRNNLNSNWALESLYVDGIRSTTFIKVLKKHIKPVYDSACLLGYEPWVVPPGLFGDYINDTK